jgi:hypothetical protein
VLQGRRDELWTCTQCNVTTQRNKRGGASSAKHTHLADDWKVARTATLGENGIDAARHDPRVGHRRHRGSLVRVESIVPEQLCKRHRRVHGAVAHTSRCNARRDVGPPLTWEHTHEHALGGHEVVKQRATDTTAAYRVGRVPVNKHCVVGERGERLQIASVISA